MLPIEKVTQYLPRHFRPFNGKDSISFVANKQNLRETKHFIDENVRDETFYQGNNSYGKGY